MIGSWRPLTAQAPSLLLFLGVVATRIRIPSCVLAWHLHTPLRSRQLRRNYDETVRGIGETICGKKCWQDGHCYPACRADRIRPWLSRWLRYRLSDNVERQLGRNP